MFKMRTYIIFLLALLSVTAYGQTFHPPVGSAMVVSAGAYNLTPDNYAGVSFATGAVWSTNNISFNSGFEIKFKLAVDLVKHYGADGICVVFGENINPLSLNGQGGNLGYYNDKGGTNDDFQNSFAVEIDHYPNHEDANDDEDSTDHIMIAKNGGYYNVLPGGEAVSIYPSGGQIATGEFNEYKIQWNCSNNSLKVYFNDSLRMNCRVDYPSIFTRPDYVKWGFTGAAALSYSNHILKDISFSLKSYCPQLDNFIIYPGQGGMYHISGISSTEHDIAFKIYNIVGQLVYSGNLKPVNYHVQQSIHLGNIATGIYLIKFDTRKENNTLKFPALHY